MDHFTETDQTTLGSLFSDCPKFKGAETDRTGLRHAAAAAARRLEGRHRFENYLYFMNDIVNGVC